ncbi:MAG: dTDP-4-dehydrorhamnose reductase [Actinobacteria bacterium]|nr:dTDP-4-dehydrorhamnose reductase [Actinomycetota bacterium]
MVETSQVTEREINVWTILGGYGQLGQSFHDVLSDAGITHEILGRNDVDITSMSSISSQLAAIHPTIIVNCAAWTAVDNAEDNAADAFLINETGARNVALVAKSLQSRLVHISTDYVFPGTETGARAEDAPTGPSSVYGASKLAGENAVLTEHGSNSLVVRTAWLYSQYGGNFVKTMIRKALTDSEVRVVNDQLGQPTHAAELARHVVELVQNDAARGVFHGTNSGSATWFDLTVAIYELLGVDTRLVTAVDSSAYPTKAQRPNNSVLGHQKTLALGIQEMRPWHDALSDSITSIASVIRKELTNES